MEASPDNRFLAVGAGMPEVGAITICYLCATIFIHNVVHQGLHVIGFANKRSRFEFWTLLAAVRSSRLLAIANGKASLDPGVNELVTPGG